MSDSSDHRPSCKYGLKCYQKNPEHLKRFSHPSGHSARSYADLTGDSERQNNQTACWYGTSCYNKHPYHRSKFSHPSEDQESPTPSPTPSYWNILSLTQIYAEVSIGSTSIEFNVVSDLLNETLRQHGSGFGTINRTDPKGYIVTGMRRVYNQLKWEAYAFQKTKIIERNQNQILSSTSSKYIREHPFITPLLDESANEYWLFHGCSKDTLDILTHKGYDHRIANVDGMFGGGFYLAENSSKANQYIPCPQCGNNSFSSKGNCTCSGQENIVFSILVYRAVLGDIHVVQKYQNKYKNDGKGPVRRPPTKNDKGDVYDSVLGESRQHGGDSLNFREVILYELGQAYPEYVIDFKRSNRQHKISASTKSALEQSYDFLHGKN